jgi:gp32 DNA binding protein like
MSNTSLPTRKSSRTQYLASLRSKINEMSNPKGGSQRQDDERYWKPEVDKAGTGSAIIRFLPAKVEENFPFVQLWSHGFQGPTGKWFIDQCPTSIEEKCPACEANGELWQTGNEAKKKLASSRKRKLNYISNILVVNDPKHPENNGKVFLYKFGKKIFEKIKDMINPPEAFADMASVDPFDMVEGANFKLRITRQDNFPNYDKSSFDAPTPIGDEDRIAEVENQLFSLNELLDTKHFKSYADLKKRFDQVAGGPVEAEEETTEATASGSDEKPPFDTDEDMPVAKPKATNKATTTKTNRTAPKANATPTDEEDYFAKLAANANTADQQ